MINKIGDSNLIDTSNYDKLPADIKVGDTVWYLKSTGSSYYPIAVSGELIDIGTDEYSYVKTQDRAICLRLKNKLFRTEEDALKSSKTLNDLFKI